MVDFERNTIDFFIISTLYNKELDIILDALFYCNFCNEVLIELWCKDTTDYF